MWIKVVLQESTAHPDFLISLQHNTKTSIDVTSQLLLKDLDEFKKFLNDFLSINIFYLSVFFVAELQSYLKFPWYDLALLWCYW